MPDTNCPDKHAKTIANPDSGGDNTLFGNIRATLMVAVCYVRVLVGQERDYQSLGWSKWHTPGNRAASSVHKHTLQNNGPGGMENVDKNELIYSSRPSVQRVSLLHHQL